MRILLIAVFLFGCSAQYHLRTAIKKDPTIIQTDTVITYDTVWVEVEKVNTVFRYDTLSRYDTITRYVNDVKIRYAVDTVTKETFVEADCPDCPEITKTEIRDTAYVVEPDWVVKLKRWGKWIVILSVVGGVLILIRRFTNWIPFW